RAQLLMKRSRERQKISLGGIINRHARAARQIARERRNIQNFSTRLANGGQEAQCHFCSRPDIEINYSELPCLIEFESLASQTKAGVSAKRPRRSPGGGEGGGVFGDRPFLRQIKSEQGRAPMAARRDFSSEFFELIAAARDKSKVVSVTRKDTG